ncbi:AAA family ATPase [Sphingomonas sp. CV7422]|uniref:AAA family ATPase n=1 Tax=Sphingomonas sp. CV7422 TaxID=3018036 RepID=UPI0022FF34D2|nr:AAA family ATPase [Sphingomonas sp. CV7422]
MNSWLTDGAGILKSSNDPNEVFTPRSHDINQRTYVERRGLEHRLLDALGGRKYIIIHGESGNGKTWLFKKVLSQAGLSFQTVNLANANTVGSLEGAFEQKLGEIGHQQLLSKKTEIEGGARPFNVGIAMKETTEYKNWSPSAFSRLLAEISHTNGGKKGVLVLDNFEQVVENEKLVKEVANLIISADEESIAVHNVKVLIVGTPNNIRHMISRVSNAYTISNRLIEIPEVARLEPNEAFAIMAQGFERHLRYTFTVNKNELYKDICWKTDRIAQEIQELCLKIALEARRNSGTISKEVVAAAEEAWAHESLSADLGTIELLMNSRDTKVGRKNQVLYCLGTYKKEDFKYIDIERSVRERFDVEDAINLNIPQILASFTKTENPLLRRHPSGEGYRFVSPKLKMIIRARFKLDEENRVIKLF